MTLEAVQIRIHGTTELPTLIYLPGLHGNWMLIGGLRQRLIDRVRFIEITYPSTLSWSVEDHAAAIEAALAHQGISEGWLLAESFSCQMAWPLVARGKLKVKGVILAGGFVRHPLRWAVRMAQRWCNDLSFSLLIRILLGYARVSRFRFRRSPETFDEIQQFVTGLSERDFAAAKHRLRLVAENDPAAIARQVPVPVYGLSGLFDPVVPWFFVRRWLRHHCPALKAYRVIWHADHNVLGSAPDAAAKQILRWMALPHYARNPIFDRRPLPKAGLKESVRGGMNSIGPF